MPDDSSPSLLDAADPRPVHFMGIAGAGMSALAELFVRRGIHVSGCDGSTGHVPDLERLGVAVSAGHDPAHVRAVRALVVTSAVPRDHAELEAARRSGIPVIRRAEALGLAVNEGRVVAVAGTHGKTTTTVMTTEALRAAGHDATGVVGGRVQRWRSNLKFGSSDIFVVEADEYDRSFLALRPTVAVITNVEADHLDIYRDLDDIRATFVQFAAPAHTIVVCDDDAGAASLPLASGAQVMRYGVTSTDARVRGEPHLLQDGRTAVAITYDGECLGDVVLQVPGLHNVRNALAAIAAGLSLGADLGGMRAGLEAFTGVERRFQRLGSAGGVVVIDDYAHHPTELAATLDAARSAYPGRRIVAAFQPHLYTRTRDFAREFGTALAQADVALLTEIYPAREQPLPGVSAELIAASMRAAGHVPEWRGVRADLANALASMVREGDVVLTLGAGDITRTGPELLARLTSP
jgi:UDP-N-acetylmuramate--alanine ligase